jgi:hypothetical protein
VQTHSLDNTGADFVTFPCLDHLRMRKYGRNVLAPTLRLCTRSWGTWKRFPIVRPSRPRHSSQLGPRIVHRLHRTIHDQYWIDSRFQFRCIIRDLRPSLFLHHINRLYISQAMPQRTSVAFTIRPREIWYMGQRHSYCILMCCCRIRILSGISQSVAGVHELEYSHLWSRGKLLLDLFRSQRTESVRRTRGVS